MLYPSSLSKMAGTVLFVLLIILYLFPKLDIVYAFSIGTYF